MWQRSTEPEDRRGADDARAQHNIKAALVLLGLCTVILLLVSTLPAVLVPPALSQLLAYASLGTALVAGFRRDKVFADHLTGWDRAAALLALSLLAGLFTDSAAVEALLESLSAGAPTGPVPEAGGL